MSTCAGCSCTDKSQCTKGKGYSLDIIETEKSSYIDTVVMEAPEAENNGKCKCGTACACVDCKCGN